MKRLLSILILSLSVLMSFGARTTMVFSVGKGEPGSPYVIFGQQRIEARKNHSTGNLNVVIDLDQPAYVTVHFSKLDSRLCYLEPGCELVLHYTMPEGSKSLTFDGSLARENKYVQNVRWNISKRYGRISVSEMLATSDSLKALDIKQLDSQSLNSTFKQWEERRIEVNALSRLLRMHIVTDTTAYLSALGKRMEKDASWMRIPAYRHLLDQYVRMLVRMNGNGKSVPEGEQLADMRVKLILENLHQPDIVGYLIDITLFHLASMGIQRYNDIYHKYVRDTARLALYDKAAKAADKIAPGKPCPDFCFYDQHGNKITLNNLKGKYVYIDFWATWCGPCKGEMPSLLALEKKFEGRKIEFVSISVDKNDKKELWKKTIEEMQLGGIQLHLGEQWDWLKIFMPSGISVPRFVILDPQGNIVNAHAPRPSDPAATAMLEKLLDDSKGIKFFEGSFDEALRLSEKENKLIFMDCYADWCGPCKNMERNVFTQKAVGDFFNSNFICMKCNMEKNEAGRQQRDRFDVVAYPTLLFISKEGFVTQRRTGFASADTLIAFAKRAMASGQKSDEQLFANGKRDEAFLKNYLATMLGFHQADAVEDMLNTLYNEQGVDILADADYWKAFVKCYMHTDKPLCADFIASFAKFCQLHGRYDVQQKVRNLYASFPVILSFYDVEGRKEQLNTKRKEAYLEQLEAQRIPDFKLLQQEVEYLVMLKEHDYEGAYRWGQKCLKKADARILCNWAAWGERMVRGNQQLRNKIAQWADEALEKGADNKAIVEEATAVKSDLLNSPNPVFAYKGSKPRTTIPIRGY